MPLSCIAAVARPQTLESLQFRDGARKAFTGQADDIACTKREQSAVRCLLYKRRGVFAIRWARAGGEGSLFWGFSFQVLGDARATGYVPLLCT